MDRAADGEAGNGGSASRQRSAARRAAADHRDRARPFGVVSVDRRLAGWRRTHGDLRRDGCVAVSGPRCRRCAFDRFWRSLMAEGAAAGEGLQLRFDEPLSARGSRARFTLRDRRMAPAVSTRGKRGCALRLRAGAP